MEGGRREGWREVGRERAGVREGWSKGGLKGEEGLEGGLKGEGGLEGECREGVGRP